MGIKITGSRVSGGGKTGKYPGPGKMAGAGYFGPALESCEGVLIYSDGTRVPVKIRVQKRRRKK